MKATEIQIADWVKDKYKPKPHQVDSWADFNSAEDLSPVPITPEILKKNGWNGYDFYRTYGRAEGVFNDDYSCEIGFDNRDCFLTVNAWEYTICEINGVHELQHALRLCGLNDLADNFKV